VTVTRCTLPFMRSLSATPMNADAIKALLAQLPETCPHEDCTKGAKCREVCRVFAQGQWVKSRNRK
jgi:hypothetical protein